MMKTNRVVRVLEKFETIETNIVPAWDERHTVLPGDYPIMLLRDPRGEYEQVRLETEIVHAKKSALWGGVAVSEPKGPDAGTKSEIWREVIRLLAQHGDKMEIVEVVDE